MNTNEKKYSTLLLAMDLSDEEDLEQPRAKQQRKDVVKVYDISPGGFDEFPMRRSHKKVQEDDWTQMEFYSIQSSDGKSYTSERYYSVDPRPESEQPKPVKPVEPVKPVKPLEIYIKPVKPVQPVRT